MKTELVHHRQYNIRAEARRDIFAYIEGFYNRTRLHSAIGYIAPIEMELKSSLTLSTFLREDHTLALNPTGGSARAASSPNPYSCTFTRLHPSLNPYSGTLPLAP
ncbi:IS3 family transposase [uncultured Bradyrhizobium sp.]|uniref:IS3 family transposase n=1 Tax=uncultured Bradyrhizobium sp. TaxID=199684 RepID=UPI0035CC11DA